MATPKGIKHPQYQHGHKSGAGASPTYNSWRSIIGRCCNPNQQSYQSYGAKGLTMCPRWRESFANFLADMGERPPGTSIDRIDNSKGYAPDNCRWSTPNEQARNRAFARLIVWNGEAKCCAAWAEQYGIPCSVMRKRLAEGWSMERATSTPVKPPMREIEFMGERKSVTDWARSLGIHPKTFSNRINRGWAIDRAIASAVQHKTRVNK